MRSNLLIAFLLCGTLSFAQKIDDLKFIDAQALELLGRAFDSTEGLYGRLPLDMKNEYREELWKLGTNTAGVAVRFSSNAKVLGAKWSLQNDFSMSHMASTGIKGIDLYVLENSKWYYVGTGRPNGKQSSALIINNMEGTEKEYLAYLPLYDAAIALEFGCDSTAFIAKPKQNILRSHKVTDDKSIVFYGTSIVQGGCASRPGMIHTSMIGRALQTDVINLGFSGNARCDKSMLKTLQRIDANAYVLDFMPNCTLEMVKDSAEYFISNLAKAKPDVKIYIVENIHFPTMIADIKTAKELKEKNEELYAIYNRLKGNYKNLILIKADDMLGIDGEATVDGVHLSDLGFMRFTENLLKYISPEKAFVQLDSLFGRLYPADEPGAAVLILKGDDIIYKKGFGIADMTTKEPVTGKTFFNIASVSKQFSAVALMMLHEEGKLSLDDNVSHFFPQFKASFFKNITLRHLLSHTSGIPDSRPRHDRNFVLTATDEDSYAYLETINKLNFDPGTAYEYMNPTFQLMYTIVEKASGMKFDDFMRTRIFDVAGMSEATYFEADKTIPHFSHGYIPNKNGKGFQQCDYGEASFFATKADGGLYTSVEEFVQWEKALRNNLLISKEMCDEAWSKQINIPETPYTGYGYGWYIEEKPGYPQKVYHTGNNGGYQIFAGRYPDKSILYLIFATRDDKNREAIVTQVDEIMKTAGWLDEEL